MNRQFNVLIIGAGSIGAFFDKPTSQNILSHAHAFTSMKQYRLLGFIDVDKQKAQKAAELWNCQTFYTIEEAFKVNTIDIVCIATPDNTHYELLKNISRYKVKLVFSEKPLAIDILEANNIREIYKTKGIPLMVNYSRRFVPEFNQLRLNIKNGLYGKFITGMGYYGKGILHNGSHMIDLLRFLLGEIENTTLIDSVSDYSDIDPSVSGIIMLADKKRFYMQNINHHLYTIFELDFLFEKKRIRIVDSGFIIEEYSIEKNELFVDYKNITSLKKTIKTKLGRSMYYAANNIYNYLKKTEKLQSPIDEAYKTMEVCLKFFEQI